MLNVTFTAKARNEFWNNSKIWHTVCSIRWNFRMQWELPFSVERNCTSCHRQCAKVTVPFGSCSFLYAILSSASHHSSVPFPLPRVFSIGSRLVWFILLYRKCHQFQSFGAETYYPKTMGCSLRNLKQCGLWIMLGTRVWVPNSGATKGNLTWDMLKLARKTLEENVYVTHAYWYYCSIFCTLSSSTEQPG